MAADAARFLREDTRLRLNEGACLPLRSRFGQCRACESACPVAVLTVSIDGVSLAEGCTGCGRCAAACPNEALQIEGFELPVPPARAGSGIEVECAKVPAADRGANAQVVPCLGGLSAGRLAELAVYADDGGLEIVDRGWCRNCSSGGGEAHPAAKAIDTVAIWFESVTGPGATPRLVSRPLPPERMPAEIPQGELAVRREPKITRRQFFRTLGDRPLGGARVPMGSDGRAAYPASARRPSPERARLLAALDTVAERRQSTVPVEMFPRVTNNGACADHRVCTAACPTGALQVANADGHAELRFSGEHCIACGACARACPEEALALQPHGGRREVAVIARHRQEQCAQCGEAFSPKDGEAWCLACAKSRRFLNDAVRQLYGAGR